MEYCLLCQYAEILKLFTFFINLSLFLPFFSKLGFVLTLSLFSFLEPGEEEATVKVIIDFTAQEAPQGVVNTDNCISQTNNNNPL